jgi:hypothetical protein
MALEPLSLAKIAILAHVLNPFPMPVPIKKKKYRKAVEFKALGTKLRLVAVYTDTTSIRWMVFEPLILRANQLAQSFRDYVTNTVNEVGQDIRKALLIYGQMPLNIGYSFSAKMSAKVLRSNSVFIPTAVVLDRCELRNYEADYCYVENLDRNERVAYLVDGGLILTVFYIFVESSSAPLQIRLQTASVAGEKR